MVFGMVILALAPLHKYLTFTVEIDFPRYADHASSLSRVLTWEQFVPLGYPFLLWLLSKLGISLFAAGQILAALSAVVCLVLVYALARIFLPPGPAVLAQVFCAANWHFAQYGILCGTDLPWTTLELASFVLLFRALRHADLEAPLLAGLTAGFAYDLRYQTLIALPWMAVFMVIAPNSKKSRIKGALGAIMLALGFFAAASPQLALNLSQQHALFPTGHAKNIWMGMHGEGNWEQNWAEAEQHDDLLEIIKQDPDQFFRHWAKEKEAAILALRLPLLALGIQPVLITLEPGPKLRLIFLFILASLGLGILAGLSWQPGRLRARRLSAPAFFLIGYAALHAGAMAVSSFRLLLPLLPIAAIALVKITEWFQPAGARKFLTSAFLALTMALFSTWGFEVTLQRFQCRVKEVEESLVPQGEAAEINILSNRAGLYRFHLPYQWMQLPLFVQTPQELQKFALSHQIPYLLFEQAHSRSREAENWPELKEWAFSQKALYEKEGYPALILLAIPKD
jgi:4-amino-4-deoxy-L-arabinose transferase-like glycosyltransferase